MKNPVLNLLNINIHLSDFFSLKDIYLDLYPGEVHVIIGENGSGKSSLMNVILGYYLKDSGSIFIDDELAYINSPIDAKKYGIAMIHQDPALFDHFTVAENIYIDSKPYLISLLKIIDWSKLNLDCEKLFDKFNLKLNSKSLVKDLSIAQKQLVEICKAYVSDARIIIMDEPTSALTDSEASLLFKIIKELKKSQVSIFYISHKLEEIKKIGDRITIIRGGKIIGTENIDSMNVDSIIKMMTGMELTERYPKLTVKLGREILRVSHLYANSTITDINFTLRRREILGVIGLVGSGRSKIAKCLFGKDKVDSGDIFIDNKKIRILSTRDAINAGIGCVTEDRVSEGLFMYMSVAENITSANTAKITNLFLIDKNMERTLVKDYIERLQIKTGNVNDKAAYLSGGNQEKVVLAKWIMSKSKILILDEPTKGIDIASKVDVYNVINELVTKDVAIILISSDVDEVLGMCDRIIILYEGKIAAILPRKDATRKKIMFYATGQLVD